MTDPGVVVIGGAYDDDGEDGAPYDERGADRCTVASREEATTIRTTPPLDRRPQVCGMQLSGELKRPVDPATSHSCCGAKRLEP